MTAFGGILESACLSVRSCIRPRVLPSVYPCVQNTSFSQSAGGGIKSHLVTAVVDLVTEESIEMMFYLLSYS